MCQRLPTGDVLLRRPAAENGELFPCRNREYRPDRPFWAFNLEPIPELVRSTVSWAVRVFVWVLFARPRGPCYGFGIGSYLLDWKFFSIQPAHSSGLLCEDTR